MSLPEFQVFRHDAKLEGQPTSLSQLNKAPMNSRNLDNHLLKATNAPDLGLISFNGVSRTTRSAMEPQGTGATTVEPLGLYHFKQNVIPIQEALEKFGFSTSTFYRFRIRHKIQTLTGGKVHIADILAAFEAERNGKRRCT